MSAKPEIFVLQKIWIEHPAIIGQLVDFIGDPGYGSFTLYAEHGTLTYAEHKRQIKDQKDKPRGLG